MRDALSSVATSSAVGTAGLPYLKRTVANRSIDLIRRRRDVLVDAVPETLVEERGFLRDPGRARR